MPGPYDEIDIQNLYDEACLEIDEAIETMEQCLEAMKWFTRSRGKTYDLEEIKQALEQLKKIEEEL